VLPLERDDTTKCVAMNRTEVSAPSGELKSDHAVQNLDVAVRPAPSFADFELIQPGDEVDCRKTISEEDLQKFAQLSGDTNPLHVDEDFAARTQFQQRVVNGMLLASYVSALVGTKCPGPGALWSQQSFRWKAPVFVGDQIHIKLRVTHKSIGSRSLAIVVTGTNGSGSVFMEGDGVVSLLEERIRSKDIPLAERVAFINGASGGTGATIASALAATGTAVAVGYAGDADEAEEISAAIEKKGGRAISVQVDVTDAGSFAAGILRAREHFNRPVDILINNSENLDEPRAFVDTSWQDVQSALDRHLRGAFYSCQAVIPGMREQKSGRIVNIGSTLAWNSPPANWSSFVVAKSALKAFTRCLATELGPHGIRVNLVSPGLSATGVIAGVAGRARKVAAMQTPLRRLASPDDIAATVVALCSEAGEFVTGADIPVCGGLQM